MAFGFLDKLKPKGETTETVVEEPTAEVVEQEPVSEVIEEVVEETPVVEETVEETPVVEAEPIVEAESTQEPVAEEPAEVTRFDTKTWIEQHEENLLQYLQEKRQDYGNMANDAVVKAKLKREHPEWDEQELAAELAEKYAVGLNKREIDPESMSDEEIASAEAYNKNIDRGLRLLKTDAKSAREFFEEQKKSLQLPELEVPAPDLSQDLEKAQQEYQVAMEAQQKQWEGTVEQSTSAFQSVRKTIKIEDNGAPVELTVEYKLSEDQKKRLDSYLKQYPAHPEADKIYLQEDGKPNMAQFVSDKAALLFQDQIIASALKEARAQLRKELLKESVNHDDGVIARPADTDSGTTPASKAAVKYWESKRKRLV